MKQTIKLNESQLRQITKRVLNESCDPSLPETNAWWDDMEKRGGDIVGDIAVNVEDSMKYLGLDELAEKFINEINCNYYRTGEVTLKTLYLLSRAIHHVKQHQEIYNENYDDWDDNFYYLVQAKKRLEKIMSKQSKVNELSEAKLRQVIKESIRKVLNEKIDGSIPKKDGNVPGLHYYYSIDPSTLTDDELSRARRHLEFWEQELKQTLQIYHDEFVKRYYSRGGNNSTVAGLKKALDAKDSTDWGFIR